MADVVFLVVTVAFFAVAVGLVRACERLVGEDAGATDLTTQSPSGEPERAAA